MNKATIVRPDGLADNVDLHRVICSCGYAGRPSSNRSGLVAERDAHVCPKPTRSKRTKTSSPKARRPKASVKAKRGRAPGRGRRR